MSRDSSACSRCLAACSGASYNCDSSLSDCLLPTTNLGDNFCNSVASKCGSTEGTLCDTLWRKPLNDNGQTWRDDIIDLDRKCLAYPDCGDVLECHQAWTTAVGL